MESAVVKNGILYCPSCGTELTRLFYKEDGFWSCNEDSCFGKKEYLLWDDSGSLLGE